MTQCTINTRTLRAVNLMASVEETRFYLRGVLVTVDADGVTYVATDGHRLAVVRVESEAEKGAELTGAWIIPSEIIAKLPKPKKNSTFDYAILRAEGEGDGLQLTLTPVGESGVIFKPIAGQFPDWARVIPKAPSGKLEIGRAHV